LHVKSGVSDDTAIPAHVLIGDISPADITFILYFNELSVYDSTQHLQYMPHYLISRNCLNESDLIICLEISNLLFHSANYFEVVDTELELSININLIGDLPEGVSDDDDISFLESSF
jgi:hypothetical protein